ncbi:AraC family ligand binding domain-containing protein, partial [Lachnospiraceae bacterium 29-91]
MENAYVLQLSDQKFQDLYLCFCGYAKCEPLHSFGPAVRPNYILHYILEGVVSESNCTEKKIADSVYQIWRKSG